MGSAAEALICGVFTYAGCHVVYFQWDFMWPSSRWWKDFAVGGHEIMRSDVRCYYIAYMARYCQAMVSLLIEPRRKDLLELMVHHAVSVFLIYSSYVRGWSRVGAV